MEALNLGKLPILLFFLAVHSSAASSRIFEMENYLKECVSISDPKLFIHKGAVYADVALTIVNEIGHCGCTSMKASYVLEDGTGKEVHYRRFLMRDSRHERFYAGKPAPSLNTQKYLGRLNCAAPL